MASDLRLDPARTRSRFAPNQRPILSAKVARPPVIGELCSEVPMSGVSFCYHHQAARIFVEPVHNSRSCDATDAGEA